MALDLSKFGIVGEINGDVSVLEVISNKLEKLKKIEGFLEHLKTITLPTPSATPLATPLATPAITRPKIASNPFTNVYSTVEDKSTSLTVESRIVSCIIQDDCAKLAGLLPSFRHNGKLGFDFLVGKLGFLWCKHEGSFDSLATIGDFAAHLPFFKGIIAVGTRSGHNWPYPTQRFANLPNMAWSKLTTSPHLAHSYVDETLSKVVPFVSFSEIADTLPIHKARVLKNIAYLDLIKTAKSAVDNHLVNLDDSTCLRLSKASLLRGSEEVCEFFAGKVGKTSLEVAREAFGEPFIKLLNPKGFRYAENLGIDMAEVLKSPASLSGRYVNKSELFKKYLDARSLNSAAEMDVALDSEIELG